MDCLLASYTGRNRESFLVGGDVGLGIATFGYLFPFFQIFMYMILLSIMDQFVNVKNNVVVVPVLTLLSLYTFFYTFKDSGAEDLQKLVNKPEYITIIEEYSPKALVKAMNIAMNHADKPIRGGGGMLEMQYAI